MSIFVAQRHYDHIMSAPFQKAIMDHNRNLGRDKWVAVGRVLTPNEREDYDTGCALKRLILAKLRQERVSNPKLHIPFIIVDKRSLRLRIDKEYVMLDDATARYGIAAEAVTEDRARHNRVNTPTDRRAGSKRPGPSFEGPGNKLPRN
ncbi:unnamed protein product [Cylicocyclus nassatus]|uniref:Uncharacterized protein n=1 Tax=Cylicocyclus nassatus TaxID=53992 RepID=A0AA36GGG8_CYLNA|nr:unnamed protein product [Cylicocyclus nassatus]